MAKEPYNDPNNDPNQVNIESYFRDDAPGGPRPVSESDILAQLDAEQSARSQNKSSSAGLIVLLLAPLAMIIVPLLLVASLRSRPTPPPVVATASGGSVAVPVGSISWQTSLDAAQALARQSGKNLMVDFYADW